jgi:hypothetical protein
MVLSVEVRRESRALDIACAAVDNEGRLERRWNGFGHGRLYR